MKGTIVIKPHPKEVIDVDPQIIENLKNLLKDKYEMTEEEIQAHLDQDALER